MKEKILKLIRLLRFPQTEWKAIVDENAPIGTLRKHYVLPLMLCVIAVTLFKCIWNYEPAFDENNTFETLLKICSKELVIVISAIFVGYHIAVLLISGPITDKLFKIRPDYQASANLVAYILSYYLILKIIITLFPILFFFNVALLFLLHTIWYGIPILFPNLEEEKHNKFTLYAFVIIFTTPFLMEKIMMFLMHH